MNGYINPSIQTGINKPKNLLFVAESVLWEMNMFISGLLYADENYIPKFTIIKTEQKFITKKNIIRSCIYSSVV